MAKSHVRYYPVGNGSMSLIKLDDSRGTTILVDMCISNDADDKENKLVYDSAKDLRSHLKRESDGRLHLNLLVHSHGDDDHVRGLQNHFWLGDPADYESKKDEPEKIIIDEVWSSTRYRKYDTQSFPLGDDAKALSKEIRRRVEKRSETAGNYVRILGDDLQDDDGDEVPASVRYPCGASVDTVAGKQFNDFSAMILGPLGKEENEDDKTYNDKNRGSLIVRFNRTVKDFFGNERMCSLVFGDDTEVRTWERLYDDQKRDRLEYDVLLAPHHCSWHSLSWGSAEDKNAKVSVKAKGSLSNANAGAYIILSCKSNDDEGEKSKKVGRARARPVYEGIVGKAQVICTGEHAIDGKLAPIVFELTVHGISKQNNAPISPYTAASAATIGEPLPHG